MAEAAARGYDTDLADEQWALGEPFVRAEYSGLGPYHQVSRRAIVNAILYQNRTGCQWRLIPHEYPNWHTVRHYYDRWRMDSIRTSRGPPALSPADTGTSSVVSTHRSWSALIVSNLSTV